MLNSVKNKVVKSFDSNPQSLVSPSADALLAGGLSILIFLIFWLFFRNQNVAPTWSWAVYYAAFVINYPHFASSYQMIYGDSRQHFGKNAESKKLRLKLWWAGAVVPAILIAYFLVMLSRGSATGMGYLVNAMFFFVGWHYVKQIFGCVTVLSALKKYYLSSKERWLVLISLYALWMVSFLHANSSKSSSLYLEIPYSSFAIPSVLYTLAISVLFVSTLACVAVFLRRYFLTKQKPAFGSILAYISIFIWLLPSFYNGWFFFIVPFFHSLQYMLFVLAHRKNKALAESMDDLERVHISQTKREIVGSKRKLQIALYCFALVAPMLLIGVSLVAGWNGSVESSFTTIFNSMINFSLVNWLVTVLVLGVSASFLLFGSQLASGAVARFCIVISKSILLGLLMFAFVPTLLDVLASHGVLPGKLSYDSAVFGATLYLFFFTIFINIHHYFIDNVIWKKNSPAVRRYLISSQ